VKRLAVAVLALAAAGARADSPTTLKSPSMVLSKLSSCLATVVSGDYRVVDDKIVVDRKPVITVFRLRADGSLARLWRMDGWHAYSLFVSDDCRYLVIVRHGGPGHAPAPDDLALAFFDRGKLLKRYRVVELLKDPSRVRRTVSSYGYVAYPRDPFQPDSEHYDAGAELGFEYDHSFAVKTVDGLRYRFDARTGEITETTKP
jgi:hypothetical protein